MVIIYYNILTVVIAKTCSATQGQFWRDLVGKYKAFSHTLKSVVMHDCLHMLSGKNFGGILLGNTVEPPIVDPPR